MTEDTDSELEQQPEQEQPSPSASLYPQTLLPGRADLTAEQQSINNILADTAAQAEADGVNVGLPIPDPPNPDPVPQYLPRFDIDVPIDERVTLLEQADGTTDPPEEPSLPDPLNPNDPVSPLATSDSTGAGPAYDDGVLRIPPDPPPSIVYGDQPTPQDE